MNQWRRVWSAAAADLGFEVCFDTAIDELVGSPTAEVHVPQFGAQRGMLIFAQSQPVNEHGNRLLELGYGYTAFDPPKEEEEYERSEFVEMLSEWGWSGSDQDRPTWLEEEEESE